MDMTLQITTSNTSQYRLTDWLTFEPDSDIQSLDVYGIASGLAIYLQALHRESSGRERVVVIDTPLSVETRDIDGVSAAA